MTEQPYTPSLDEVRHDYAVGYVADYQQEAREAFDRMIEAVRAEEREKAARIAESVSSTGVSGLTAQEISARIMAQGEEQS